MHKEVGLLVPWALSLLYYWWWTLTWNILSSLWPPRPSSALDPSKSVLLCFSVRVTRWSCLLMRA